ncbi:MAG: hypothetical protein E7448_03040 [Ruminococcaceae bacterium]|nr:hypothetical protein [Oscillospiraceae bacterium]
MKRTICLVLAAIALFTAIAACAGCSKESDALIGIWAGEVNYANYFNQGLNSIAGEGLAEYWAVENFPVTLILTFREDGTYSMTVDEAKLSQTIEDLKKKLTRGLRDFMQDLIDASESTMTVDEFMASMDISAETMIAEAIGPDVVEALVNECTYEGNYSVKDGKLYTSAALAYQVDKSMYEVYEVTKNTLTFMSVVGGDGDSLLSESLYPFTLIRTN